MMNQSEAFQAPFQISFPGPSVLFQTRFNKMLTFCNTAGQTWINI